MSDSENRHGRDAVTTDDGEFSFDTLGAPAGGSTGATDTVSYGAGRRGKFPRRDRTGSAAGGPGYDPALKRAIEAGEHTFGGRLFRHTDKSGFDLISHAVMNDEFVTERVSHYSRLRRVRGVPFVLSVAEPAVVDEYTVYSFEVGKELSLRELSREYIMANSEGIRDSLLQIINRYRESCYSTQERYVPLCCISMDTVFIDEDGGVRILPLQVTDGKYPAELPREAGTRTADITTDIYSVIYLYYELKSGVSKECPDVLDVPDPDPERELLMSKCLSPFRKRRPSLEDVFATLCIEGEVKPVYVPRAKQDVAKGAPKPRKERRGVPQLKRSPADNKAVGMLKGAVNAAIAFIFKVRDFFILEEPESDKQKNGTQGVD